MLSQFLIEAVFLSSVGGALGIALGLLAARGIASALNIPFVIPLAAIPLAFVVSVAVGGCLACFPPVRRRGPTRWPRGASSDWRPHNALTFAWVRDLIAAVVAD